MSGKVMAYAHHALAASGFVVLNSQIACTLRPDLWTSGMECSGDFGLADTKNKLGHINGVMRFQVRLAGIDGAAIVLARSADQLSRRVEWVTGHKVEAMEEAQTIPAVQPMPAQPTMDTKRLADEKLAKLRALAAQDPPTHECHLRREILRARDELARTGA